MEPFHNINTFVIFYIVFTSFFKGRQKEIKPIKSIQPSDNLYIYYVEGVINSDEIRFYNNNDFLGNWVEQESSFLFFSSPCDELVNSTLSNNKNIKLIDRYKMTYEQWHGDKIEPYTIGNLLISPPWEREKPLKEQSRFKHIILDPGVVFGTGKHQTTEDCLFILKGLLKDKNHFSVMDIGSGTGLLSVGAAMLGATNVLSCDFNFLAAKTTLRNIRLNDLEDKIQVIQAKGEEFINLNSDIVVANIHYDVMKDIIEEKGFLEKNWFILSGLLRTQAKKVLSKLEDKPVTIIEHRCPDGIWNTILGKINGIVLIGVGYTVIFFY
jgi:ribosomal protein L11 methyltransferase